MGDNLTALTTVFTEFYYWITIVIMFLIHVGFCTYEVGVSRRRLRRTNAAPSADSKARRTAPESIRP